MLLGLTFALIAAANVLVADAVSQDREASGMKPFVLIFRQVPSQLSPADLERRANEVRTWAQKQNADGRKLDPRILGEAGHAIAPDGTEGAIGGAGERLSAILFLEARDLADAIAVARSHPGLRFGAVGVEVRPWAPPAPPATGR